VIYQVVDECTLASIGHTNYGHFNKLFIGIRKILLDFFGVYFGRQQADVGVLAAGAQETSIFSE
jgi:hypothetical protein